MPIATAQPARPKTNAAFLGKAILSLVIGLSNVNAFCATNSTSCPVEITKFYVDGRQQPLHLEPAEPAGTGTAGQVTAAYEPSRISIKDQHVEFFIGPRATPSSAGFRFRYRLEGYEEGWHEIGGPMRFVVQFRDALGSLVGSADFPVQGNSAGWTGHLDTSQFIDRREIVNVPPRAVSGRIWLPSGGNPDTLGIFIIDDLKVTRLPAEPGEEEKVLLSEDFEAGKDLDDSLGMLDGWVRDGTSLSMAQIVKVGPGMHDHALGLIDGDTAKFGAWDADTKKLLRVQARDKLLFEWKEMYSVGAGGGGIAAYNNIPAGDYRFTVMVVNVFGLPTGAKVILPLRVVPPFYQQGRFQALMIFLGVGLLAGGAAYGSRRRLQRRLERLEMQHLVAKERTRIAQDLHDDLGTRLTRISLLSEAIRRDATDPGSVSVNIDQISGTTKEMTRALDEIVWATDPEQDSLDGLVSYLVGFAQHLLEVAGIKCRLSIPSELPPWTVFSDVRHNLFLAFSEALNNVIKHAHATEVCIGLELGTSEFSLTLTDNGRGFDMPTSSTDGNPASGPAYLLASGRMNLKSRLERINGALEIESKSGQGTTITFRVPAQP
jgi:signal transduction histidine kinase